MEEVSNTLKRICIIGVRASGKTTLARKLGEILRIPVCFTDALWWKANWQVEEDQCVEKKVREVLRQEHWILEGYIEPLSREKLQMADVILYLDYSSFTIVWNGLKRWYLHRKVPRAELAEGCVEKMTWEDFKVLLFRKERKEIEEIVQKATYKTLLRFKNKIELEKWVQRFALKGTSI